MSIYLDYNASAPIDDRVLDVMIKTYKNDYGNADSRTHDYGESARIIVEDARGKVASLLGINKDEVFFTSGATESNNIAIQGLREYGVKNNKKHIIISAIEHKAVTQSAMSLISAEFNVDKVYPDISGRVSLADVKKLICDETLLVSIMHVNNETGIIQPVNEVGKYLKEQDILFHIDATQSCGKLVEELRGIEYDMLSLSAHKLSGPQGVGALILRKKGYKLPPIKPIMYGGSQEHGLRPGTIPVALVAGLGEACKIAENEFKHNDENNKIIKSKLIDILNESGLEYEINGNPEYCISNTINICIKGVSSEALMLSSKQYCGISNGSACNSNEYTPSFVLKAMGIPTEKIENSIRISWGHGVDVQAFETEFKRLVEVAKDLVW